MICICGYDEMTCKLRDRLDAKGSKCELKEKCVANDI